MTDTQADFYERILAGTKCAGFPSGGDMVLTAWRGSVAGCIANGYHRVTVSADGWIHLHVGPKVLPKKQTVALAVRHLRSCPSWRLTKSQRCVLFLAHYTAARRTMPEVPALCAAGEQLHQLTPAEAARIASALAEAGLAE